MLRRGSLCMRIGEDNEVFLSPAKSEIEINLIINLVVVCDNGKLYFGAINSCTWNDINAIGYLRTKIYEKGKKVNETELNDLIIKHISWDNESIKKWSLLITP